MIITCKCPAKDIKAKKKDLHITRSMSICSYEERHNNNIDMPIKTVAFNRVLDWVRLRSIQSGRCGTRRVFLSATTLIDVRRKVINKDTITSGLGSLIQLFMQIGQARDTGKAIAARPSDFSWNWVSLERNWSVFLADSSNLKRKCSAIHGFYSVWWYWWCWPGRIVAVVMSRTEIGDDLDC